MPHAHVSCCMKVYAEKYFAGGWYKIIERFCKFGGFNKSNENAIGYCVA